MIIPDLERIIYSLYPTPDTIKFWAFDGADNHKNHCIKIVKEDEWLYGKVEYYYSDYNPQLCEIPIPITKYALYLVDIAYGSDIISCKKSDSPEYIGKAAKEITRSPDNGVPFIIAINNRGNIIYCLYVW